MPGVRICCDERALIGYGVLLGWAVGRCGAGRGSSSDDRAGRPGSHGRSTSFPWVRPVSINSWALAASASGSVWLTTTRRVPWVTSVVM
jgi:hypothetical protein